MRGRLLFVATFLVNITGKDIWKVSKRIALRTSSVLFLVVSHMGSYLVRDIFGSKYKETTFGVVLLPHKVPATTMSA